MEQKDVAPFPEPPKYWKLFTNEHWRQDENLQPPAEPHDGKWKFLGSEHALGHTRHQDGTRPVVGDWAKRLTDIGVDLLVAPEILGGPCDSLDVDKRREALEHLNHALVFNFLELLDIMCRDPGPVRGSIE